MTRCYLEDDGGAEVYAVEAAPDNVRRQSLHVRVGPVYSGGLQQEEPGIWIEYQIEHTRSDMMGPVLLTPAVWRELNRAVEDRLRRKGYGKWRTRLYGVRQRKS